MYERSGGLIGRTSWQTVWAQTLVGGLCNEFLGKISRTNNTSLNSKLQYLTIPLSTRSYNTLQYLSQLEVTIPYNTVACLTLSSLLLSLCFLVVCPDKKEYVFHSDECGEGE